MTNWTLSLIDNTLVNETLTGIILANSYFTILDPNGVQNNDGQIIFYDGQNNTVDNVTYGSWDDGNTSDNAPTGNSNNISDECLSRVPNGYDSSVDSND